jgi:hypothetical protein
MAANVLIQVSVVLHRMPGYGVLPDAALYGKSVLPISLPALGAQFQVQALGVPPWPRRSYM